MPDRANVAPAHRRDESFEVLHRQRPIVVSIGSCRAVSMTALIVAVDMADRAQWLCKRAIYSSEKSGRVQKDNRLALAAPVQGVQPDAVDVDESGLRFGKLCFFHSSDQRFDSSAARASITSAAFASGERMSSSVIVLSTARRALSNFSITRSTRGSLSRAPSSVITESIASART